MRKSGPGAEISTRLIVSELVPADLGQPNEGLIDGGATDLILDLRARGTSPQQLAASLEGEIVLEIQRATIRNNVFELIGSDVLMQTVRLINPYAQQDDVTHLECAALRLEAVNGILSSSDQLVIETSKVKIRGSGEVNLGEETLRIDLQPSARQGLGISVGDLAGVVRVDGTLGDPRAGTSQKHSENRSDRRRRYRDQRCFIACARSVQPGA